MIFYPEVFFEICFSLCWNLISNIKYSRPTFMGSKTARLQLAVLYAHKGLPLIFCMLLKRVTSHYSWAMWTNLNIIACVPQFMNKVSTTILNVSCTCLLQRDAIHKMINIYLYSASVNKNVTSIKLKLLFIFMTK